MRKNGVNRELYPIEGGVCAPEGFRAGGISCGIKAEGKDLALIVAERRCPTACVYSTGEIKGAPIMVTQKNLRDGYAHAAIINGGIANVFLPDGERLARQICEQVGKRCCIINEDVVIGSTGEIGKSLSFEIFERGVKVLSENLGKTAEYSLAAAQAITGYGEGVKQLSFAFELGAFSCKIGAIFKGDLHVSPNMATTLVFLTTDVNISPEMLSCALAAGTRETLNLLNIDGEASPNDMVCIMANGKAGNYRIACKDTEYKKFAFILRMVLAEVCRKIAAGTEGVEKILACRIKGARSKQIARILAKRLVGFKGVRDCARKGELDIKGIIFAVAEMGAATDFTTVSIEIRDTKGRLVLYEDGKILPRATLRLKEILSDKEIEVCVSLGNGNFEAISYGRCETDVNLFKGDF